MMLLLLVCLRRSSHVDEFGSVRATQTQSMSRLLLRGETVTTRMAELSVQCWPVTCTAGPSVSDHLFTLLQL